MKIIGIDSSGMVASVALVADGVLIAEYTMNHKKTHSQTLLPMLDQVVRDAEIELAEIDAIAVAAGPGSFTGLRIGAATVKGLALALEKPVIPVPTCEGLAYNLSNGCMYYPAGVTGGTNGSVPGLVVPIMDARRGQVYTGIYRVGGAQNCDKEREDGGSQEAGMTSASFGSGHVHPLTVVEDQMALAIEELLEKLERYGEPVTFLGDGVPVFRKIIEETCRVPFAFAPAQSALQRAASVATLAEYYAGLQSEDHGVVKKDTTGPIRCMVSADDFKPIYLRKSQAEREHEAAAKARQAKDLAEVAEIEAALFSDAWSVDTLKDTIKYDYNHILLIDTEGGIRPLVAEEDVADSFVVGEEEHPTAGYLIYADPTDEAELHRVAVLPEYRRRGLARKLMAEMLQRTGHGSDVETKHIFLEVRAGNAPAIALYSNCDFQEIDRRKNYYHDPDEDAVIMKR